MDPTLVADLRRLCAQAEACTQHVLEQVARMGVEPMMAGAQIGQDPKAVLEGTASYPTNIPIGHMQVIAGAAPSAHQRLALETAGSPLIAALEHDVGPLLLALRAHLPFLQGTASSIDWRTFLDRLGKDTPTLRTTMVFNGVHLIDRRDTGTSTFALLERVLAQGTLASLAPADRVFYPGQVYAPGQAFPAMDLVAAASIADARALVLALDPGMVPHGARDR